MGDPHVIARTVLVRPRVTLWDGIRELGMEHTVTPEALMTAPRGCPGDYTVKLFRSHDWEDSDEQLAEAYQKLGLRPVDADTIIDLNYAHPTLRTAHSHMTHWFDGENWCYITVRTRFGEKPMIVVNVNRRETKRSAWAPFWWHVGVSI